MEALRDIKDLVAIEDYSLYIFIFIISITLVAVGVALVYIVKKLQQKKRNQKSKQAIAYLSHMSFKDAKTAAYEITYYARLLINNDNNALYQGLLESLEKYKYKSIVPLFEEKDKALLHEFLGTTHV